MALIGQAPAWRYCTSNVSGTPSTNPGTQITSGGSANTDGLTTSLIAAITHDVEFLEIILFAAASSTNNTAQLTDIMIDPAGGTSWATDPIISDLISGHTPTFAAGAFPQVYRFPLWLPSGCSIGARARNATTSKTSRVIVNAYGGNAHPASWWCGQYVESIGITAASSLGTSHTSGNSGSFSSWTNIGSTLSYDCGALQFGVSCDGSGTVGGLQYHMEFGVGSTRIGPTLVYNTTTAEQCWGMTAGPIFSAHPVGTQFQVRGTCSGTAEALTCAVYAVV